MDHRPARSRTAWPRWLRVLVALICTFVVFKLYAGVHLWPRTGCGPGVTFSPTGCYVGWQSVMSLVVTHLNDSIPFTPVSWRLSYALGVVLPPAMVSLVAYVLLTHLYGQPSLDEQPRCRVCGYLLRGISKPRCPECGECI